jgi:hypothetical protein
MSAVSDQILASIHDKDYQHAYSVGLDTLTKQPGVHKEVVTALHALASRLRSECMDRALKKNDHSDEYFELESLLRKVNALTGEGMYGKLDP